jgi:hypothetical protein
VKPRKGCENLKPACNVASSFESPVLKEGGDGPRFSLSVSDCVNLLVFLRRGVPRSPERLGPRLGPKSLPSTVAH